MCVIPMIPDLWKAILETEMNWLGICKNGSWCAGAIPLWGKCNEGESWSKTRESKEYSLKKRIGGYLGCKQQLIATVGWFFGHYPALACSSQEPNFRVVKLRKNYKIYYLNNKFLVRLRTAECLKALVSSNIKREHLPMHLSPIFANYLSPNFLENQQGCITHLWK